MTGFNPTVDDVQNVRLILITLRVRNQTVPMEIALMILSFASYHPRQSNIKKSKAIYRADEFWRPGPEASIAGLYLTVATLPLSDDVARAQSITFQMKAADQGWADNGGEGTYHNSHTWFEASILRPESEASTAAALEDINMGNFLENNGTVVWRVHNNITARRVYRRYRVDWVKGIPTQVDDSRAMGDGQGFLELLRGGDLVAL
ncbi:hypothetical protein F5B17DRAFT_427335 [Nemania serpens]|nr:hypothetical protein F5B17DRAFT_427335 [Nemania serpens]